MADGDRAAVDIDLAGVPAEVLVDGAVAGRDLPSLPVVFSNLGISEVASSFRRTQHLDDATVLRAAAAYEAAAPWKDKWPPMLAQMGL
jgi:hypothetical protein